MPRERRDQRQGSVQSGPVSRASTLARISDNGEAPPSDALYLMPESAQCIPETADLYGIRGASLEHGEQFARACSASIRFSQRVRLYGAEVTAQVVAESGDLVGWMHENAVRAHKLRVEMARDG